VTVPELFKTRDTVAVETPANLATSRTVQDRSLDSTDLLVMTWSELPDTGRDLRVSFLPMDHDLQVLVILDREELKLPAISTANAPCLKVDSCAHQHIARRVG
jgi:hypothetical protein